MTAVTYVLNAGSKNFSRSDGSWIKLYEQSESATVSGIVLTRPSSKALSKGTVAHQCCCSFSTGPIPTRIFIDKLSGILNRRVREMSHFSWQICEDLFGKILHFCKQRTANYPRLALPTSMKSANSAASFSSLPLDTTFATSLISFFLPLIARFFLPLLSGASREMTLVDRQSLKVSKLGISSLGIIDGNKKQDLRRKFSRPTCKCRLLTSMEEI